VDVSVFRRHHNTLRIFEGTRQEATVLASLDKDEQRSAYWHRATTWAVTWHDHTVTWVSYTSVEKCQQLTAYALSKPYLRFRFSQSGVEFKSWCARVNELPYSTLIGQSEGFPPVLDKTFKPFALAIQSFDASNKLQGTSMLSPGGSDPLVHMLQSAHWNAYLTAYLVQATHSRYEVCTKPIQHAYFLEASRQRGLLQVFHCSRVTSVRAGTSNSSQPC